jgi:hypothetical protein
MTKTNVLKTKKKSVIAVKASTGKMEKLPNFEEADLVWKDEEG